MLELPDDADDVQLENAPLRRHRHGQYTIEGYSRGAVQTYFRVPELKLGFDFGLQPWSFMATPSWCLSHGHLDHIAALPVYVSRRRLMKMSPPVIFLPEEYVDDVTNLLEAYRRLVKGRMPCRLEPCVDGDEFDLSREYILSAFRTRHTAPSLGYIVWERRKKLKAEYQSLSTEEIRRLAVAGEEVSAEVRSPLLAFTGDTTPAAFDENPVLYEVSILITEVTFVAKGHSREKIHKYGHIHLDDILDRADLFRNQLIVAGHASTRLNDHLTRRTVESRLPESLKDRFLLWL